MIGPKVTRLGLIAAGIALLAVAGCARKELVRSNEGMQPQAANPAPAAPTGPPGGIASETVKPEAPAPSAPSGGAALTKEQPSPFRDIHFDFDKSFIRDPDKPTLDGIAAYLKSRPGTRVLIEGNCDERGTEEYNMMLGDRRAAAARKYLVELGIPANALSTISFGKDKPVDPGHNEEAWAKNSNDHFVVQ